MLELTRRGGRQGLHSTGVTKQTIQTGHEVTERGEFVQGIENQFFSLGLILILENYALMCRELQIRDPDPTFFPPGSQIPIRIKEVKYFNPQKWFISFRKYDPGCSSQIRILTFYPSWIPDPGVKKAPDPGSATLNV
jgi:hypothetical protein